MAGIKNFIVENFSFIGKYKRWMVAFKDALASPGKSYSQYGEDVYIASVLDQYDVRDGLYVDIGANHPTDISNTYLLYRKGMHGVVIEPNQELISLFRQFRKRDIALGIGCSNNNTVLRFNISKTPVLSSFSNERDINIDKQVYLPVITLDNALASINPGVISFLSIDVEGLNIEVLQGAASSLKKTLLLCIEFDDEDERIKFGEMLNDDFDLIKTVHCNLIYLNRTLAGKMRK